MKPNEIVKDLMKRKGFSNKSLADKLGKPTPSSISNPLSREKGMRIDTFLEMVTAMDCEVVVRDKNDTEKEWIITIEDIESGEGIDFDLDLDKLLGDPTNTEPTTTKKGRVPLDK